MTLDKNGYRLIGLFALLCLSSLYSAACQPYVKSPLAFDHSGSGNAVAEDGQGTVEGKTDSSNSSEQTPATPSQPTAEPPAPTPTATPTQPDKPASNPTPPTTPTTPTTPNTFDVTVTKLTVGNPTGAKPSKGDSVILSLTLKNAGSMAGNVKVTPILTSRRFNDYANVRLATQTLKVMGGETKVNTITVPTFFRDEANNKEYALNRGNYSLGFEFEPDGKAKQNLNNLEGRDFEVTKSNVVFTAVYWDQSYFDKMKYTAGIDKYLKETYSRKGEILKPTQQDGTTGAFTAFPNGFDEMMKVRTVFKTFDGFKLADTSDGVKILKQVEAFGKTRLGLTKDFQGTNCDSFAHEDNHGFDMEIGLSNSGFGGIAWMCGNTQASGVFDGDPSIGRSQMVLIHETGHNYGAPHCDPIQGFIMCSGEKHDHYKQNGSFVWHQNSIDKMTKQEPQNIENHKVNFVWDGTATKPVIATCNGFN